MSATEAQSEPTMEEILASIRRIISEDDKPSEADSDAEKDNFGDNVLELDRNTHEDIHEPSDFDFDMMAQEEETANFEEEDDFAVDFVEKVEEPKVEATPAPEPAHFIEPEAPVVIAKAPVIAEPVQEPAKRHIPPKLEESIGLIGEDAANAASQAFAKLGTAMPGQFASGVCVEELVAFLLKPMLKDWLDKNLPRIVEERVEAELARIARRGF